MMVEYPFLHLFLLLILTWRRAWWFWLAACYDRETDASPWWFQLHASRQVVLSLDFPRRVAATWRHWCRCSVRICRTTYHRWEVAQPRLSPMWPRLMVSNWTHYWLWYVTLWIGGSESIGGKDLQRERGEGRGGRGGWMVRRIEGGKEDKEGMEAHIRDNRWERQGRWWDIEGEG